nr:hypothetical protein [uncultured Cohaesibacter sp.]
MTKTAAFPTIKALQCYAAMLGFSEGRREPFDGEEKENIEWHTFENDGYTHFIYMISLAHKKNIDILKYDVEGSRTLGAEEDMVKIFEEYANGGFNLMQIWFDKSPEDPFGIVGIISGLQKGGYMTVKESPKEFDDPDF